jgi:hypothetical protein
MNRPTPKPKPAPASEPQRNPAETTTSGARSALTPSTLGALGARLLVAVQRHLAPWGNHAGSRRALAQAEHARGASEQAGL